MHRKEPTNSMQICIMKTKLLRIIKDRNISWNTLVISPKIDLWSKHRSKKMREGVVKGINGDGKNIYDLIQNKHTHKLQTVVTFWEEERAWRILKFILNSKDQE